MIAPVLSSLALLLVLTACGAVGVRRASASDVEAAVAPAPTACVTIAPAPSPSLTPHPTSPMAGGSTLAVALAALPSAVIAVAILIAAVIPWWRVP